MPPSPFLILSYASPTLERYVAALSEVQLSRLIGEVRRLRPLLRTGPVPAVTVLRLAATPLTRCGRTALKALLDYAAAHPTLHLRVELLRGFRRIAACVQRRVTLPHAWRCVWGRSHGGWRLLVWERDRRRADLLLSSGADPVERLVKTMAALGASRVLVEHEGPVPTRLLELFDKAGVRSVISSSVPRAYVQLVVGGIAP